jgi:hypothetical protein
MLMGVPLPSEQIQVCILGYVLAYARSYLVTFCRPVGSQMRLIGLMSINMPYILMNFEKKANLWGKAASPPKNTLYYTQHFLHAF